MQNIMSIFFILLLCVAMLLTLVIGGGLFDYHKSDAAGEAMARAFTFFEAIALALVLAGMLLICGARGGLPGASGLLAMCWYVGAISGLLVALHVLGAIRYGDRFQSLLQIAAIACPALLIAFCIWSFFPALRERIPMMTANLSLGLPILALSITAWSVMGPSLAAVAARRQAQQQAFAEANAKNQAVVTKIEALPDSTPLTQFLAFAEMPQDPNVYTNVDVRGAALARMRKLPNRQKDAETLLNQANTAALRNLADLDLQMTPALCEGARKSLHKAAEELKPATPTTAFDDSALNPYTINIGWLLENKCECKAEVEEIEQTIRLYPESFDRK